MKVNKKLMPIKGHYFLFNAGTAPLVPYLSTYARQLGFSSATVGLIYTVLPVFGLIAKPLFGVIADRLKIQKSIFILFQIVTIVSFGAIYFVPGSLPTVDLDCGSSATELRSCYRSANEIDMCNIDALGTSNETATCNMKCYMRSPKLWQTLCEHWHIPQYCYGGAPRAVRYQARVANVSVKEQCAYLSADRVVLDGYSYKPNCRIGDDYVDINAPCRLQCGARSLAANMTCVDKTLNYRTCDVGALPQLQQLTSQECNASCDMGASTPWRLMEVCEGWGADAAASCQPQDGLPDSISFVGHVPLHTTMVLANCVFVQLHHITMEDGSVHYPSCVSKAQYQKDYDLFQTYCETSCSNSMINEVFQAGYDSRRSGENVYDRQFWLFFLLMIISWIGQAVVVTFADAICFNLLGNEPSLYGRQRLWGSVGWGIFSLLTGALIDVFSEGAYKDYTVAFILMFVFMSGDAIVSCFLRVESTKMSVNILADVGTLLTSVPTLLFMAWTIAVGMCTGLLWQFLFWHIEDIAGQRCGASYVKTLQGLVSAIQTFAGEIPFLFVSGHILRKVGHVNTMSLVLLAFGVRFLLYSAVTDAWWILPVEILQGITFGMFYPTLTSYANVVAPPGTETTVQGLVGAIFEGVGASLGSFIGGRLYTPYGGWNTFRWFGLGALVACAAHALAQWLVRRSSKGRGQGYTSVVRYGQPADAVYILEDSDQK